MTSRAARRFLMLPVLVGLAATPLLSHDFWLVPLAADLTAGGELIVHGQTGSNFPGSLSAVTPDRLASVRILAAHTEEVISDVSVQGNSLRLAHRPAARGQVTVTATIHPRSLRESPESFRRYLTLEGAPEALERYERAGLLPLDSITRRYAKYAKAVAQIGRGGPRAFERLAGHPLEFVPLGDPAAPGGAPLKFRVLFQGTPLSHAKGHASAATGPGADSTFHAVEFETNARGEFELAAMPAGLWNVRALHIVPAPAGSGADWDVHWATFVWWRR